MRLEIELTETELRNLVYDHLRSQLGSVTFKNEDVKIEVKSKQNYKSEWEDASFRAKLTYFKL